MFNFTKKIKLLILFLTISISNIYALGKYKNESYNTFLNSDSTVESTDSLTPQIWVDNFPSYPICSDIQDNSEKFTCVSTEIKNQILNNFIIPESELKKAKSVLIILSFVIDTEGNPRNFKIVKGINSKLDKETLRAAKFIKPMIPGTNLNQPTSVLFTIPIRITIK
jgi:hypothetical protein